MKKSWKFMIGTLIVLFIIYVWLKNYSNSIVDMESKVGSRVGGGELTTNDYYTLKTYIELYKEYISEGKYETAYRMLGASYRRYISYEEFVDKVKEKNIDDLIIEDINIITDTTYEILLSNSGERAYYSMVVDDTSRSSVIYPESFLDYKEINKKVNKKKVEVTLKDYIVNADRCILNFSIKNNSNETVNFSNSKLLTNEQGTIENDEGIVLNSKETKEITIEYDTNYEFPSQVTLCRGTDKEGEYIDYVIDIK